MWIWKTDVNLMSEENKPKVRKTERQKATVQIIIIPKTGNDGDSQAV